MKTKLIVFITIIFFVHNLNLSKIKNSSFLQIQSKSNKLRSSLREYGSIFINLDKNLKKAKANILYAYYNKENKNLYIVQNKPSSLKGDLVAYGKYDKSRFEKGWDLFESKTYSSVNPIIQCYSAGLIEGIESQSEIKYYINNFNYFLKDKDASTLKNWFTKLDKLVKKRINTDSQKEIIDGYDIKQLSYMACIHAQITGIYLGYNLVADQEDIADISDIYILNSSGNYDYALKYLKMNQLDKIKTEDEFFKEENLKLFYNTTKINEIWEKLISKSKCSALVRYISKKDGTNDIYVGHNTWTNFNELLRTYKKISFAFEGPEPKNQIIGMQPISMTFSSYPGLVFSADEFYTIGNNLVITQTSLSVINAFLYKDLIDVNRYIPEFMRMQIVNFLSRTGKEWEENYVNVNKNNHLYSASFIVIDYNNISSDSGLMYIVEDIPGSVKTKDYSFILKKKGYYGSFNLPYFKNDHGSKVGLYKFKDVDFYGSIEYNPRKYIADMLAPKVNTIDEFKELLMYNKYGTKSDLPNDPSLINPNNGLAARIYFSGAIDFKIIDKNLINNETIWIYCGPVYGEGTSFNPFSTKSLENADESKYIQGIPKIFDFIPFYFN